jgi:hypothetical protein
MKRLFAGLFGVVLMAGSALAQERVVTDAVSAEELKRMMTASGLAPTMMNDRATGAPVATGQADGLVFVVRALDCSGRPSRCSQLLLFANFELGRDVTDDDYRIVNRFNEQNVNGRAYVLEGKRQIGIDYVIDMTGGVTNTHIGNRMGRWPAVIADFKAEMIRARTGS